MPDRAKHERDSQWAGFGESYVKTKKCNICGGKNNHWIRFCDNKLCSYSMCTPCCDSDPCAIDRLENGCWCRDRSNEPGVQKLKDEHVEKHVTGAMLKPQTISPTAKSAGAEKARAPKVEICATTQPNFSQHDARKAKGIAKGAAKETSAVATPPKPAFSTKPSRALSALVRSGPAYRKPVPSDHANRTVSAETASGRPTALTQEESGVSGGASTMPFKDHPPAGYKRNWPRPMGSPKLAGQSTDRSNTPSLIHSEMDVDGTVSSPREEVTSVSTVPAPTPLTENSEPKPSGKTKLDRDQTFTELGEELAAAENRGKANISSHAIRISKPIPSIFQQSRPVGMDGKSTVIVGGGVIGLSIARELAVMAHEKGWNHSITVVELRNSVFAQASGHNAGILTTEGLAISPNTEALADLAVASMDIWMRLGKDKTFCDATGYTTSKTSQVFVQHDGQGESPLHKSSNGWFKGKYGWAYADQDLSFGLVNPPQLGIWLLEECTRLGVDIKTNSELTAIGVHHEDGLSRARITSLGRNARKELKEMPCHNLILAAGPWTSQITSEVLRFEESYHLRNVRFSAVDWLEIQDHRKTPQGDSAFTVPSHGLRNFHHPDPQYQLHVVSRKNDRKIWISGSEEKVNVPGPALVGAPSTRQVAMRQSYPEYLAGNADLVHQPASGRSFSAETNGGLPLIARRPLQTCADFRNINEGTKRSLLPV